MCGYASQKDEPGVEHPAGCAAAATEGEGGGGAGFGEAGMLARMLAAPEEFLSAFPTPNTPPACTGGVDVRGGGARAGPLLLFPPEVVKSKA